MKIIQAISLLGRMSRAFLVSIPGKCAVLSIFFYCYHKLLVHLMERTDLILGYVSSRGPAPLHGSFVISFSLWLLPALTIVTIYCLSVSRFYLSQRIKGRWLLLVSLIFFWLIAASVSMIDGYRRPFYRRVGPLMPSILEPFSQKGHEYYGDVPKVNKLGGPIVFTRDYVTPRIFERLGIHPSVHPPGGILFLWLVSRVFGYGLWPAVLATLFYTGLALVLGYWLARRLTSDAAARIALALWLVTPNFVLFTCTSMEGPFSVFLILSLYLFYRAFLGDSSSRPAWGLFTGIAMGLSMFMTYSTFFLGLFFFILLVMTGLFDRGRFKSNFSTLLWAGAGFLLFYGLLILITGFNPITAFNVARAQNTVIMGTIGTLTQYVHIVTANLFAFLIGVGIPLTVVWGSALWQTMERWKQRSPADIFSASYVVSLLIICLTALYRLEVERIWIFMAPFLLMPAANYLQSLAYDKRKRAVIWTVSLSALQLVLFEATLSLRW